MKQKLKILSIVLMLILGIVLLTGCSLNGEKDLSNLPQVTDLTEGQEGFSRHTEDSGISFAYPVDWVSVGTATQPMYMDATGSGSSVNYLTEEISEVLELEIYVNAAVTNVKANTDMSIVGEIAQEEFALNGKQAFKLSYQMEQSGMTLNVIQVVIKTDGKVHMITTGGLSEETENMAETYEKIVSSLKK